MVDLVLDRWQRRPTEASGTTALEAGALPRVRPRRTQATTAEPGASWRELVVVSTVAMVLGFAQGASVAVGSASAPEPAPAIATEPEPAGTAHSNSSAPAVSGRFWRPAGSSAEPPEAHLKPRRWDPTVSPSPALSATARTERSKR